MSSNAARNILDKAFDEFIGADTKGSYQVFQIGRPQVTLKLVSIRLDEEDHNTVRIESIDHDGCRVTGKAFVKICDCDDHDDVEYTMEVNDPVKDMVKNAIDQASTTIHDTNVSNAVADIKKLREEIKRGEEAGISVGHAYLLRDNEYGKGAVFYVTCETTDEETGLLAFGGFLYNRRGRNTVTMLAMEIGEEVEID